MKFPLILFAAFAACACSHRKQSPFIMVKSVNDEHPAYPAPSVEIVRMCPVHERAFSYAIIYRSMVAEEAPGEARAIEALRTSAPNAILIPNSVIVSLRILSPGDRPTTQERIFEFCPACEEIKRDALKKKTEPNKAMEPTPVSVTDHAPSSMLRATYLRGSSER